MSLLPFLRCPRCRCRLSTAVSIKYHEEIKEGMLTCEICRSEYPILAFIPRFVPHERYSRSFSIQWNMFPKTQLDHGQKTESRDAFIDKTGIDPELLSGKIVLDAGCGMGRFSEVVSNEPKNTVVSFDLSQSVDAAFANLGSRSNVHIVQGDIMMPPFTDESFDLIFSIGALHHMPDPRKGFRKLVPLLRKGGEIAIWVYAQGRWVIMSDIYREFTSRMPHSMVLTLSKLLIKLYTIYRKLPWLAILLPISMHKEPEWRLLDTFDWYSPKYQHKYTGKQVLSWFTEMGLQDIKLHMFPVSASGRRPITYGPAQIKLKT